MARTATDLTSLLDFIQEVRTSAGFQLEKIKLDQQQDWAIKEGALSHKTGGFFHVIGVRHQNSLSDKLYFYQPQSGITGLLVHATKDDVFLLTKARVEPGSASVVQLSPTVQATPANFLRLHQGKATPYLVYVYSASNQVLGFNSTNHLDIGRLYYQKTKWLNYALVDELLPTEEQFIWVSLSTLCEAARESYIVNTDLRSLLAAFDWDALNGHTNQSTELPSVLMQFFLKSVVTGKVIDRFVPIDRSPDFLVHEYGVSEKSQAVAIDMYTVSTRHREVSEWVQPLWSAEKKGWVILYCRVVQGQQAFLLSVLEESGVAGKYTVGPSELIYPDESHSPNLPANSREICTFYQSDECGRFINHEYCFQVIEVPAEIPTQDHQFWVSPLELKQILTMSNLANIQLRSICSALVKEINPFSNW
ncbi:MAG: NDP-hexose 2,3-dehydratase family protein [Bacteroidota bacterium]